MMWDKREGQSELSLLDYGYLKLFDNIFSTQHYLWSLRPYSIQSIFIG